jgi:pimeloyl-ACP methyl ester carboxylesterase
MQFIPTANNIIAYMDFRSDASFTLFFLHGNSNSSRLWAEQIRDNRFTRYRMVLLDLPWHGESAAGAEQDCNVRSMGQIMADVVKQLANNKPYMLIGFSLGSNVLAEMLAYGLDPCGIFLAGASLVGSGIIPADVVNPGPAATVLYTEGSPDEMVDAYINDTSIHADAAHRVLIKEDYYKVKAPFRSLLGASIPAGLYSDEIALLLGQHVPLLVAYGADDKITPPWLLDGFGIKVIKVPGASHLVMMDQPAVFNELLESFIQEVMTITTGSLKRIGSVRRY